MAAVSGTALRFDGTDNEIDFADNAVADISAAMTFSFWINVEKYQDDGQNPLFYRASTWDVRLKEERVQAKIYGGVWADMGITLDLDTERFVVLSITEGGSDLIFKLYVDSVLVSTVVNTGEAFPAANAEASKVGSDGTYFFRGYMSSIIVTSDAMTQVEVDALYANGWNSNDVADCDNEIIAIPFNEGVGASLDNDATAGWDGTIAGTEEWMAQLGITFEENPIRLRTQGLQTLRRFSGVKVYWGIDVGVGDLVDLRDQNGVSKFLAEGSVANREVQMTIDGGFLMDGLNLVDLDGGELAIYWK